MVSTGVFPGRLAFGPLPRSQADARKIAEWGADLVITALPSEDIRSLGAGDLPVWLKDLSIAWLQLPILDWDAPDAVFDEAWKTHGPETMEGLSRGGAVFIHCAAGLGRSGTIVARLLIDAGVDVEEAIQTTRETRPGAIEAKVQEAYLRNIHNG